MSQWYYLNAAGETVGPFSEAELRTKLAPHPMRETVQVAQEGSTDWRPYDEAFPPAPEPRPETLPEPPATVSPAAVAVPLPRNNGLALLLAGIALGVSVTTAVFVLVKPPAAVPPATVPLSPVELRKNEELRKALFAFLKVAREEAENGASSPLGLEIEKDRVARRKISLDREEQHYRASLGLMSLGVARLDYEQAVRDYEEAQRDLREAKNANRRVEAYRRHD